MSPSLVYKGVTAFNEDTSQPHSSEHSNFTGASCVNQIELRRLLKCDSTARVGIFFTPAF